MKAKAMVIGGSVRAAATTTGGLMAGACAMPIGIMTKAMPTDETGLHHFLEVRPEEPQNLVWLVPQVGVEYFITASKNLKWKIE
jgi:hypothetical protein